MAEPTALITREQYDALKAAERRLYEKALPLIEKLERCGDDCAGFRGVWTKLTEQISAYEREFASPPPR